MYIRIYNFNSEKNNSINTSDELVDTAGIDSLLLKRNI